MCPDRLHVPNIRKPIQLHRGPSRSICRKRGVPYPADGGPFRTKIARKKVRVRCVCGRSSRLVPCGSAGNLRIRCPLCPGGCDA